MAQARTFHVTLPPDIAAMVDEKVASGQYRSVTDVVCHGLESLRAGDAEVETWLRGTVAATYDTHMSGATGTLSLDEVLSSLDQRFASAKAT